MTARMSDAELAHWLENLAITLESPVLGDDPTIAPQAMREAARRLTRPAEEELIEQISEIIVADTLHDRAPIYTAQEILALVSPAAVRKADDQEEIDVPPLPHKIVDELRCFGEMGMADHDAAVRRAFAEEVAKWCDEQSTAAFSEDEYLQGFAHAMKKGARHCRLAEKK